MRTKIRTAAVAGALAIAGLLGTGGTALAAGHISLGPYELEASCLRHGNQGIEDEEWEDYTCQKHADGWYIHPQY